MSGNANKKNPEGGGVPGKAGPARDVQRGTQDEMEIVGLIVAQNPSLRQMVFERIRQAKKRVQEREKKGAPVAE